MNNNIRQQLPAPPRNHMQLSGDELRYSKACSDNRCSDCEWDANDCDCAHHFEGE